MPTIVSLQDHLETIRQAEIDRVRGRLGALSPEQELAIDTLTHGIVNKIMHTPISTLKTAARESEATTVVDIVRRLFNLQEQGKTGTKRQPSPAADPEDVPDGPSPHRFPRFSTRAVAGQSHQRAAPRTRSRSELEIIKTTGDKITDVALAKVGTKGMFTKEIEEALAEGRIDLAVHSLKDLPTEVSSGFEIAAVTTRENPHDVFCSRKYKSIEDLPQEARVGTSSLRRQAQLKAVRPDLEIQPLRGNVDTRLRKLEAGEYDAIILAAAGLNRLGKTELVRAE